MQVPETPHSVTELDLMKRLDAYAGGAASWTPGRGVGETARQACRTLHTNLTNLVNGIFAYVLDRVTAREMETFTMHDRVHGLKVAHLMWHILKEERRESLTPPEIGILVVAAHLHDLGMGLSPAERKARLAPDSDLWDRLEIQDSVRVAIEKLREQIGDPKTSDSVKLRAGQELFQAEEALLTQDTRERHATRERYEEILGLLADFHQRDPTKIPDVEATLSFDGDSFRDKLIDVCASHNEDADALVANDEKNLDRPRFPKDFPVGCSTADLHTVAATLRLADILDFDRERTPAVLFHYLLPSTLGGLENRSVLEWSKHLAVSNWHIDTDAVVFRGRSRSHIIHHAVVQFCEVITNELKGTHATFSPLGEQYWPFTLPLLAKADIHEEGYRYVPYKFELDDERVYSLLMGGAIYDDPLVAVRELVQNAVDACKLRDTLTRLYEEYEEPSKVNRIIVRYEEPTAQCPQPRLIVKDTGTGMDAYTLERYFLQVGRSYYSSSDFNQYRVQLRKRGLDFAPISEFGIGFLSTFLLADHVEVETAMWEPLRNNDTTKRTLKIDGPTRLIRLDEQRNDGAGRFKGTRITLFLSPKTSREGKLVPASWEEIRKYLKHICQDLPYVLNLEYVSGEQKTTELIEPVPLRVEVPPYLEECALRIPVKDEEFGIEGEIMLINKIAARKIEQTLVGEQSVLVMPSLKDGMQSPLGRYQFYDSALLRGGFRIADSFGERFQVLEPTNRHGSSARLRLTWEARTNKRYLSPNLARNSISDIKRIEEYVFRQWLTYLLQHPEEAPEGYIYKAETPRLLDDCLWLEGYNAYKIYLFVRPAWLLRLKEMGLDEKSLEAWEAGQGNSLPLMYFGLTQALLDLVLPRITILQIDADEGRYIAPPISGWTSTLERCVDYMRSPVGWGNFAEYSGRIAGLLHYSRYRGATSLNAAYRERFNSWDDGDIAHLRRLCAKITGLYTFDSGISFTTRDAELLRRAVEVAGDLKIGRADNSWALSSFSVTEV